MTHIRNHKNINTNNTKNYIYTNESNNNYCTNSILAIILLIINILFIIKIIVLKKNRKISSNNQLSKSTQCEPEILSISINPDYNFTIIKEL